MSSAYAKLSASAFGFSTDCSGRFRPNIAPTGRLSAFPRLNGQFVEVPMTAPGRFATVAHLGPAPRSGIAAAPASAAERLVPDNTV